VSTWDRRLALRGLPLFVPAATAWVWQRERSVLQKGVPLSAAQNADARSIGVRHPDRVRLHRVATIATFEHPLLAPLAWATRFAFAQALGLTLRYAILIQNDWWGDRRLVAHELAHVAQYERFGGIAPFLNAYLRECLDPGYPLGRLEQEAVREAARIVAP
jgi:hypothetical protein